MAESSGIEPRFGRRHDHTADADVTDAQIAGARLAPDGSVVAGGNSRQAAAGWGNTTTQEPAFGQPMKQSTVAAAALPSKHVFANDGAVSDTVSVIRDLSQLDTADDLAMRVAAAPRNVGRKVATLKDLEQNDGLGALNASSSRAAGVDLSLLTAALATPDQLEEPDEPWEFDRLLQEVSQVIEVESEKREAEGGAPLLLGPAGFTATGPAVGRGAAVGTTAATGFTASTATGTVAGGGFTSMRTAGTGTTVIAGRRAV